MGVPVLPFAIGLYLPISLNSAIMVGGIIHLISKRINPNKENIQHGVLFSSGLVAGDACMGVVIALLTVLNIIPAGKLGFLHDGFSLGMFVLLSIFLGWVVIKKQKN